MQFQNIVKLMLALAVSTLGIAHFGFWRPIKLIQLCITGPKVGLSLIAVLASVFFVGCWQSSSNAPPEVDARMPRTRQVSPEELSSALLRTEFGSPVPSFISSEGVMGERVPVIDAAKKYKALTEIRIALNMADGNVDIQDPLIIYDIFHIAEDAKAYLSDGMPGSFKPKGFASINDYPVKVVSESRTSVCRLLDENVVIAGVLFTKSGWHMPQNYEEPACSLAKSGLNHLEKLKNGD